VLNFVGIQATADLAAKLVGRWSDIIMIGLGPGAIPVGTDTLPSGTSVRAPVWGTRPDLIEVLDLARSGAIKVETERFSLEEGPEAYERLHAGTLRGRAVLVP
jgi:propanol-preferring alcohol dehydrogenase